VRGPPDEPPIESYVKKVWFFLHESYKPHDVLEVCMGRPAGWERGTFAFLSIVSSPASFVPCPPFHPQRPSPPPCADQRPALPPDAARLGRVPAASAGRVATFT
jgi:hypothetical protein